MCKRHILHVPGERQQSEKRLGQTHMLILDSLPERQEATRLPLGPQMLAEPFKSLFYHNNPGTGTHDSGALPLTYWHREFTCPSEGQEKP